MKCPFRFFDADDSCDRKCALLLKFSRYLDGEKMSGRACALAFLASTHDAKAACKVIDVGFEEEE